MGLVVPLHAILAMATNLDPPFTLFITPAPVLTTEMAIRLREHDSRSTHAGVETAPTSTLKHNDGHLHRASPICGLLLEHQKPANKGFDWHDDLQPTPRGTTHP